MEFNAILEAIANNGIMMVISAIFLLVIYKALAEFGKMVKNFLTKLTDEMFKSVEKLNNEQIEIKKDVTDIKNTQDDMKENLKELSTLTRVLVTDIKATTDLTRELNRSNNIIIENNTRALQDTSKAIEIMNVRLENDVQATRDLIVTFNAHDSNTNEIRLMFKSFNKDLYATAEYLDEMIEKTQGKLDNELYKQYREAKKDLTTYMKYTNPKTKKEYTLLNINVKRILLLQDFYSLNDEDMDEIFEAFVGMEETKRMFGIK